MASRQVRITNSRGGTFLRYRGAGREQKGGSKIVRLLPSAWNNIHERLIRR